MKLSHIQIYLQLFRICRANLLGSNIAIKPISGSIIESFNKGIKMMNLEPMWIWAIIGFALLAAEIGIGTMDVIWFGLGAIVVAFIVGLFPEINVGVQITVFAALSIGALYIWKNYFQTDDVVSNIGQAQGDEIGKVGIVTETCSPTQNGTITFNQGIMGSREWVAISDETIEAGASAKIIAIEGNALRVTAQTTN